MSSQYAMEKHYGKMENYRTSEGRLLKIKYKGKLENTICDYLGGLRSTCTYTNSKKIGDLNTNCKFIIVNNQYNTNTPIITNTLTNKNSNSNASSGDGSTTAAEAVIFFFAPSLVACLRTCVAHARTGRGGGDAVGQEARPAQDGAAEGRRRCRHRARRFAFSLRQPRAQ